MKTYNILYARKDDKHLSLAVSGLTKRAATNAIKVYRRGNRKSKVKHTFWVVENGK